MVQELTAPSVALFQFSVEQFVHAYEAGVFGTDARIELIDGQLYTMSPTSEPHAAGVSILIYETRTLMGECWVRSGAPLRLSSTASLIRPDFVVLNRREDRYALSHPTESDVLVLMEVSLSSLDFDRSTKYRKYARAGVTEYWIVNLIDRQIEVYTQPAPNGTYLQTRVYLEAETIEHPLLGTHRVEDLLPMTVPAQ